MTKLIGPIRNLIQLEVTAKEDRETVPLGSLADFNKDINEWAEIYERHLQEIIRGIIRQEIESSGALNGAQAEP
ncbi:MAG: hypothetical protein OXE50_15855 [Chloroflexi bacterium]|nr:hypothetical protein [Chloroflexota bacterium]